MKRDTLTCGQIGHHNVDIYKGDLQCLYFKKGKLVSKAEDPMQQAKTKEGPK